MAQNSESRNGFIVITFKKTYFYNGYKNFRFKSIA